MFCLGRSLPLSIFRTQQVTCPACKEAVEFQVVFSVNADRRPDLRAAIIDGSFQREACPKCAGTFRLDPDLNYVNLNRNEWIGAFPIARLGEWQELEKLAQGTFARAFGEQAPAPARALGKNLRPRVTFGWAALREKLIAAENNLDDVNLEIVKTMVLRGVDNQPLMANNTELRLTAIEGPNLMLTWIHSPTERLIERMAVPRKLYDEVTADPEGFAELRKDLTAGFFVDLNRLLLPAA
jgi:hypothetical protein